MPNPSVVLATAGAGRIMLVLFPVSVSALSFAGDGANTRCHPLRPRPLSSGPQATTTRSGFGRPRRASATALCRCWRAARRRALESADDRPARSCPVPAFRGLPSSARLKPPPPLPQYTDSQVNKLEITPDKQFLAAAGAAPFAPAQAGVGSLPCRPRNALSCSTLTSASLRPALIPVLPSAALAGNPHIRLYEVNSNNPQVRLSAGRVPPAARLALPAPRSSHHPFSHFWGCRASRLLSVLLARELL